MCQQDASVTTNPIGSCTTGSTGSWIESHGWRSAALTLASALEDRVKSEGGPRPTVERAYGSVERFAERLFEVRLKILGRCVVAAMAALFATPVLIGLGLVIRSEGGPEVWQVPIVLIALGIFGAMAFAMISIIAVSLISHFLRWRELDDVVDTWEQLFR